jgi:hypothetical protein
MCIWCKILVKTSDLLIRRTNSNELAGFAEGGKFLDKLRKQNVLGNDCHKELRVAISP